MGHPSTPLIDIDKIVVEKGFNPRTHIDGEALKRLAGSIERTGVVQPVTVRPGKGDQVIAVSGHRRLEAAKLAGLTKIPAHLHVGGSARAAAFAENHHREALDPIDTANGIRDLAAELGLKTNKQIAEELDLHPGYVGQHLRLLKLPEGVQTYIARGLIPIEAERDLRNVADVSPQVAECLCELAKRRKVTGRDFIRSFAELLIALSKANLKGCPALFNPTGIRVSEVIADAKRREELAERYRAAHSYDRSADPSVELSEDEVDAARAAHRLIEHEVDHTSWTSVTALILDTELARDLIERAIMRLEKEAEKRKEARTRTQLGGMTSEQDKETKRDSRAKAKADALNARRLNEELGTKMLQRRGGPSRDRHLLERVQAMAMAIIADNPNLAARGLRLVSSQLREVEIKHLKSGQPREKVSHADPDQATTYLEKRILEARSEAEVIELITDAFISALLADESELPMSKRVHFSFGAESKLAKLLKADIKEVRPRRPRTRSGK